MKNITNLSDLMAAMAMNGASSDELRKMTDITRDVIDFEKKYVEIPSHESFDKLVSMLYKDLTTAINIDPLPPFNPYISDRTFEVIGKLSPYAEKWYNTLKHAHCLYDTWERIDDARATVKDLIPTKDIGINDCLRSKIVSFVHDYSKYMEDRYVCKCIEPRKFDEFLNRLAENYFNCEKEPELYDFNTGTYKFKGENYSKAYSWCVKLVNKIYVGDFDRAFELIDAIKEKLFFSPDECFKISEVCDMAVKRIKQVEKKRSDISADEYQEEAMRTASEMNYGNLDGITDTLLPCGIQLLNGLMGLCGESGECIDILKKAAFQGHGLDIEKLKEELGDVAWYLAVSARAVDCDLSDILRGNIEKLKKRYPDGFEAERSVNREE